MNAQTLSPAILHQAGTMLQRAQEYLTGTGTQAGATALALEIETFLHSPAEIIDNPFQLQLGQPPGTRNLARMLGLKKERAEYLRQACGDAIEKDLHLQAAGSGNTGPDHIMHRATAECCSVNETAFCILSVHQALGTLAKKYHTLMQKEEIRSYTE